MVGEAAWAQQCISMLVDCFQDLCCTDQLGSAGNKVPKPARKQASLQYLASIAFSPPQSTSRLPGGGKGANLP